MKRKGSSKVEEAKEVKCGRRGSSRVEEKKQAEAKQVEEKRKSKVEITDKKVTGKGAHLKHKLAETKKVEEKKVNIKKVTGKKKSSNVAKEKASEIDGQPKAGTIIDDEASDGEGKRSEIEEGGAKASFQVSRSGARELAQEEKGGEGRGGITPGQVGTGIRRSGRNVKTPSSHTEKDSREQRRAPEGRQSSEDPKQRKSYEGREDRKHMEKEPEESLEEDGRSIKCGSANSEEGSTGLIKMKGIGSGSKRPNKEAKVEKNQARIRNQTEEELEPVKEVVELEKEKKKGEEKTGKETVEIEEERGEEQKNEEVGKSKEKDAIDRRGNMEEIKDESQQRLEEEEDRKWTERIRQFKVEKRKLVKAMTESRCTSMDETQQSRDGAVTSTNIEEEPSGNLTIQGKAKDSPPTCEVNQESAIHPAIIEEKSTEVNEANKERSIRERMRRTCNLGEETELTEIGAKGAVQKGGKDEMSMAVPTVGQIAMESTIGKEEIELAAVRNDMREVVGNEADGTETSGSGLKDILSNGCREDLVQADGRSGIEHIHKEKVRPSSESFVDNKKRTTKLDAECESLLNVGVETEEMELEGEQTTRSAERIVGDNIRADNIGGEDEDEDEEEEEFVLMDLSEEKELKIEKFSEAKLLRLESDHPVLVLDDKVIFLGNWEETIGTCLLFSDVGAEENLTVGVRQQETASKDTLGKKGVEYMCRTERVLKFRKVLKIPDLDP